METTPIKWRNMWVQPLLMIVTCGLYAIYWFHVTTKEMAAATGKKDFPTTIVTILLFVPILHFYSIYKEAELYEEFSKNQINRWIIFILWIVFQPAVWFIVQSKLNEVADRALPGGGAAPSLTHQA